MEEIELKIETVRTDELLPYYNNAKKHPRKQVEQIANSIREFGNLDPIGVWTNAKGDYEIVEGHGRLMALDLLGIKEAPVIFLDHLTDEQRRMYTHVHNQLTMNTGFDWDILDSDLQELDFDFTELGFELDDIPEVQQELLECEPREDVDTKVKPGDIWQLGRHRLMCGDSTSETDVGTLMENAKANMIFTDPPYNVNYAEKNAKLNEIDGGHRIEKDIDNDSFSTDEEIGENLWKPAFKNMREHAENDCSIYVTMPQGGAHMMMMMCAASWQVKHELIWVKNNHVLGRADYNYKHEPILFGWAEKHKFYGKGEFLKSVWEIPKPHKSDLHPTMKPLQLIENCLLNSSQKGDTVLDLFGGSGSTLIACEQLNRKCYMMELDPHYCDVIIDRWETLTGSKAVKC